MKPIPVNIGLCGLGTVGRGTYSVLTGNAAEIARRLGRELVVGHVSARTIPPELDAGSAKVSRDVFQVADDPEVDILLELIGGEDAARELALRAIANGKHVVTANKALIALHGNEIFAAARKKNVIVAYEAAVAGGIPIIKALREGLSGNRVQWLAGIINGTANFILTEMREKGAELDKMVRRAQDLGYAEADASFDVEGIDAAHKLTILASLAFGLPLQFDSIYTEGIAAITPEDLGYAEELGYRVKHLGICRRAEAGIELRVHPALVPASSLLANVNGVMNAVMVHGDMVGSTLHCGAGAGALPTASAVVADIIDVARTMADGASGGASLRNEKSRVPALGFQEESLSQARILDIDDILSGHYLRMTVQDKVGALAHITEILGDHGVNIEAVIQKEPRWHESAQVLSVIILTHEIREAEINQALAKIEDLAEVREKVAHIRVERLDK